MPKLIIRGCHPSNIIPSHFAARVEDSLPAIMASPLRLPIEHFVIRFIADECRMRRINSTSGAASAALAYQQALLFCLFQRERFNSRLQRSLLVRRRYHAEVLASRTHADDLPLDFALTPLTHVANIGNLCRPCE